MFHFVLGGCGTGKSKELMDCMERDLNHGKSVIVIAPEEFSFDAEKRLYEDLHSRLFNQLRTYSFFTLSQKILYQYGGQNQSYASDQEKLLILYQAVKRCEREGGLQILYKNNALDSLPELQTLVTKLRKEGITAEKLRETAPALASASVQLRDKAQDISRILFAYDQILQEHDLCDSLNDLTRAAELAKEHGFFEHTQVYIDEFGSFSGDQYQMLGIIMEQAENFHIAIRAEKPGTRPTGIFTNGNQTYHNLRKMADDLQKNAVTVQVCEEYQRSKYPDLKAAASQILRPGFQKADYKNHVHIFAADDPMSEVEYLCATVYQLLQEYPKLHFRDIAIAVKDPDVYRPLLERALTRYALPYDIAARKPVLHTELIRYFLALCEILASNIWHTETILRYLKNEFSGYDSENVSMLEHFCFTWSIDKDDWNAPFFSPEDEEISKRAAHFGGQLLEDIRIQFMQELRTLKNQCQDADTRKICRVLYRHLWDKKEQYDTKFQTMALLHQKEFITLWNMLGETLNTVVRNLGSESFSMKDLYPLFLVLLKNSSFATPPETLDSIRVIETLYETLTVRLNAPTVVFVPGVTDRMFPAEIKNHGIFTEQELRHLELYQIKISHLLPELYSDELLIINKITAAPSEQLYLTYPTVSAEHEITEPSLIIGELLRMFPENCGILKKQEDISLDYYAWTKASAYFHFVRNLNAHDETTLQELAALRVLLEEGAYADKIRKLTETQTEQPTHTSPEIMRQLLGNRLLLSPSGIEQFYDCPFSYFCQYCLHLYTPEKVRFSSQNVGNFAHYCLEQILSKYQQDFVSLPEEQLSREVQELAKDFKTANFSASVRSDGRFRLNYDMSGRSVLQLLKHMQEELRKTSFTPVAFEAELDGKSGLSPLSLRNGEILCRGKIDRVDICQAENETFLRVVDYKTGDKFLKPEKLADGLDMQMLVYLLALEQNRAFGETRPGGVLYLPSGQPKRDTYEDRKDGTRSKEEILRDFYQMKGLVLENALPYMESGIKNDVKSVLQASSEKLFSVTDGQFKSLEQHITQKICDMADRLYAGDTVPKPYLYQEYSPCSYCRFADICGHAESETLKKSNEQKAKDLETVFEQDNKDNGGNES